MKVKKLDRELLNGHPGRVVWFTGLSGAGKTTLAQALECALHAQGQHTFILDGDNLRRSLCKDLGFTDADRVENIRRTAEVARLMADAGLVVLVSLISPFRADRLMARSLFAEGEFIEVFVDTPFQECARRDVKGLYARALRGELKNFTGIDSAYEVPLNPELRLLAGENTVEICVQQLLQRLAPAA